MYNIIGYPHLLNNFLKQLKTGVMNRCDIKHILKIENIKVNVSNQVILPIETGWYRGNEKRS